MVHDAPVNAAAGEGPFYGYFIVAASFFIVLVGWGTFLSFGVFLEPMAESFRSGRAEISGAYSLATLTAGVIAILMGKLNDALGPRVVVSLCGFTAGLGYFLASFSGSLWQLYLFYGVVAGIGVAGLYVPPTSTIARWFVQKRTVMTGLVLIGGSVGMMIIPRLSAKLIVSFGWRPACAFLGILNFLAIASLAQALKRYPEQSGSLPYGAAAGGGNLQISGLSLNEAVRIRQFWLLCGIYFAFFFCINSVVAHIIMHAYGLGIPLEKAAGIMIVLGAGGIAGRVAIGILGDRIGNRQACLICFGAMFLALLYLLFAADMLELSIVFAVVGFCFAGIGALMAPLIADFFGLKAHGAILGLVYASDMVGGALGPVAAGAVFDAAGSYIPAFMVSAAVALAGCILILLLPRR